MEYQYLDRDRTVLVLQAALRMGVEHEKEIAEDLQAKIDAGLKKIIVDCSEMDYLSSMDLGLIVRIHSRISMKGGRLVLCSARGMVPEILRITRLDQILEVYADLHKAQAALTAGA